MNQMLTDCLTAVVTAALPVLTAYVVSYINTAKKKINETKANETLKTNLGIAVDLIEDAVNATSQEYVKQLKKTGSFTVEAQKAAFTNTYESVIALMKPDVYAAVQNAYGDAETWISKKIEATIKSTSSGISSSILPAITAEVKETTTETTAQ